MENHIIILGAGVTGLTAARYLQDQGRKVTLLDKGRGLGGRVATRRLGEASNIQGRWDHGAQFATFRDPDLIEHLKKWDSWECMKPWIPGHQNPTLYRQRPLAGMNALAKALATGLEVHRSQQIERIEKAAGGWKLTANSGQIFTAPHLISTIPLPQFHELARNSHLDLTPGEQEKILSVRYDRCLTLLAETDGPSGLAAPGFVQVQNGTIETIIDQHQKGISSAYTLVANATPAFSLEWFRRDRDLAATLLRASLQERIRSRILSVQIHGWKFAKATRRIDANFLRLANDIALAGDGFSAGTPDTSPDLPARIESAMLSGVFAAKTFAPLPSA
ncbi:FAD-dependent oxidoreductase [Kiritimatiellaeota bacterium B1221]|nr:FAD-dependent oxidoreductase [Kiritimatiellaeota bacterium B1221]